MPAFECFNSMIQADAHCWPPGYLFLQEAAGFGLGHKLNDVHLAGKPGQEQSFLKAAVAAADNQYLFTFVEGAVAGGAEVDVEAQQLFFAGHIQAAVTGAAGQENGFGVVLLAAGCCGAPIRTMASQAGNFLRLQNFRVKTARLASQPVGELGAANPFVETRKIVQNVGCTCLPAHAGLLYDQRFNPFASHVESGCQTGRATANDNRIVKGAIGLCLQPQFLGQGSVARLDQDIAVGENHSWYAAQAIVDLFHISHRFTILLDVHIEVGNALLAEEFLDPLTVGTPNGAVDHDLIWIFCSHLLLPPLKI